MESVDIVIFTWNRGVVRGQKIITSATDLRFTFGLKITDTEQNTLKCHDAQARTAAVKSVSILGFLCESLYHLDCDGTNQRVRYTVLGGKRRVSSWSGFWKWKETIHTMNRGMMFFVYLHEISLLEIRTLRVLCLTTHIRSTLLAVAFQFWSV